MSFVKIPNTNIQFHNPIIKHKKETNTCEENSNSKFPNQPNTKTKQDLFLGKHFSFCLPNNKSLSSRLASRLSLRNCLSISALIALFARSSGDKQQFIILCLLYEQLIIRFYAVLHKQSVLPQKYFPYLVYYYIRDTKVIHYSLYSNMDEFL